MVQDLLMDLPSGFDKALVLACLSTVLDPELDEPVLDLGFVHSLRLRDGQATITLQLPTSWCAINFAFIMAEDLRDALLAVKGIDHVIIHLGDHFSAAEIEAAVNSGRPFAAAFPEDRADSLAPLRTMFLRKGFASRQERLLRELRAAGLTDSTISALPIGQASTNSDTALNEYLKRRAELGLDCSPDAPLIVDQNGVSVAAEELQAYYQRIRTIRVALEANGSFCRAVLSTRRQGTAIPTRTPKQGERQCSGMRGKISS